MVPPRVAFKLDGVQVKSFVLDWIWIIPFFVKKHLQPILTFLKNVFIRNYPLIYSSTALR